MNAAAGKGLGKGLSALIGENYGQMAAPRPQEQRPGTGSGTSTLPLDVIRSGKFQPRTRFTDEQLQELAQSIRKNGIMQPIIVRPLAGQGGQYEIIAGERRWRAARLAGLDMVPVLVRDIGDQQALELALVENVQRQDLNPLEEANGYQRLMDEFRYTQEELAQTVGKSRSHIANLLRMLALPGAIKEMLEEGQISMGHARALLGVENAVDMARDIVRRGLNVRQAETLARGDAPEMQRPRNLERKIAPAGGAQQHTPAEAPSPAMPAKNKDPDILALEETLSENLGLRVSINDRGNSGEIVVAYQSLGQLDEILRRLGGA